MERKRLFASVLFLLLPCLLGAQELRDGFENWEERAGGEIPVGWTGTGFGSGRASEAYEGSAAASVWNWYAYAVGTLSLGEGEPQVFDLNHAGVPINFIPTHLVGYYRYEQGGNKGRGENSVDSGHVYILLKAWNPEKNDIDTIGFTTYRFPENREWQRFSIDLEISNPWIMPDSIAVIFYSSDPWSPGFCGPDTMNCCYLSIDNLALVATSGVSYSIDHLPNPARVSPNPARESALIEFDGQESRSYRIRLFDQGGRNVHTGEFIGTSYSLSTADLPRGVYSFSVSSTSDTPVAGGRVVVE